MTLDDCYDEIDLRSSHVAWRPRFVSLPVHRQAQPDLFAIPADDDVWIGIVVAVLAGRGLGGQGAGAGALARRARGHQASARAGRGRR